MDNGNRPTKRESDGEGEEDREFLYGVMVAFERRGDVTSGQTQARGERRAENDHDSSGAHHGRL